MEQINKAIKSYTDLEQSKKLEKILPLESADMFYHYNVGIESYYDNVPRVIQVCNHFAHFPKDIPCWSLTTLLGVLPLHIIVGDEKYSFSMRKGLGKNGETYAIKYAIFNTTFYLHLTDFYNSPIDAAFEMICWLKENNKL